MVVVLFEAEGKRHGMLHLLFPPWGTECYGEQLHVVKIVAPLDRKHFEPIGPQSERDNFGLTIDFALVHPLLHLGVQIFQKSALVCPTLHHPVFVMAGPVRQRLLSQCKDVVDYLPRWDVGAAVFKAHLWYGQVLDD